MSQETEEYKAIRDKIDEILLEFDFDKVADVMGHLNWEWYDSVRYGKIPTIKELRKKAYELLIKCIEEEESVASGGFEAICGHPLVEYDRDDLKYVVDLQLKFILESIA